MRAFRARRPLLVAFFVTVAGAGAYTLWPSTPTEGQIGKDVIWVSTPQSLVDRMLDMAKLTPDDYLVDLGSGDGRLVITAARRGAHAMGIEYDADLVKLSKRNAEAAGLADRATFQKADLFQTDFSKATVITMFLLPRINLELRPRLLQMKPGTRIVSNTFDMKDWQPDETAQVQGAGKFHTALLWVVPAKVDGIWRTAGEELTIKQTFQAIAGTLTASGKTTPVEGRLRGDRIAFSAGASQYSGTVSGNAMEGAVSGGVGWKATRAGQAP